MSGKQPKNEVKVTKGDGKFGKYVKYIYGLFQEGKEPYNEVIIKGAGHAISTVIPLVELLKRRIPNLHQVNTLTHFTVTDQGYDEGETINRRIVLLTVKLTQEPKDDIEKEYGYQVPIQQDLVEEFKEYNDDYEEANEDYTEQEQPAHKSEGNHSYNKQGNYGGYQK